MSVVHLMTVRVVLALLLVRNSTVLLLLLSMLSCIIVVVLSKMTLVRILIISRSRSSVMCVVIVVRSSTVIVESITIVVGVLLLLMLLMSVMIVVVIVVGTRTTESEFSSHCREGSGHLEDFLALFSLLFLEPSAVVGEFLEFGKGGGNPDTVDIEEDALVHGVDEAVSIVFVHLDEAAAVVVTAGLDVRACVEDVDARAFNQEVSEHLDAGEREVEGELGDEDITNALSFVLGEGLDRTRPGRDVFTDAVAGFAAHDGGFSDDVQEEIGNILEEVLHSTNRSAGSFLLLLLFLDVDGITVV